jgi:hypothetical protein
MLLRESRDASVKSFDALGAVLVTSGLSSLVYAITQAGQHGWLAGSTVSFFAASVALLAGFLAWEMRHPEPLMRLGILRIKTVSGRERRSCRCRLNRDELSRSCGRRRGQVVRCI